MAETSPQSHMPGVGVGMQRLLRVSNEFSQEHSEEAHRDTLAAWDVLQKEDLNEESLLAAHGILMATRTTLEDSEKGAYRLKNARVGDSMMPPPFHVPRFTRELLSRVAHMSPPRGPRTADVLTKIYPFADGNGRIARLAMYYIQEQNNEPMHAMEGEYGQQVEQDFLHWTRYNYPECGVDGVPLEPRTAFNWPWENKILRAIILPTGTKK